MKKIILLIIVVSFYFYMFGGEVFKGDKEKNCEKAIKHTMNMIWQEKMSPEDSMDRISKETYGKLDLCTKNYNDEWVKCILKAENLEENDDCGNFQ